MQQLFLARKEKPRGQEKRKILALIKSLIYARGRTTRA
jgi:hypothetical protein